MTQFNGRLTRDALRAQLTGEIAATPGSPMARNAVLPQVAPALLGVNGAAAPPQPGTDEEQVKQWLALLHLLKGVPFNYLVPDIGMLPAESIRFFQVDNNWVEALLDGAYSVGFAGVSQAATAGGRTLFQASAASRARSGLARQALLAKATTRTAFQPLNTPAVRGIAAQATALPEVLSGFLLRSAVVAGWPGLEVKGYAGLDDTAPLRIVRLEKLAPALLLCLFAGTAQRVDLQEPGEAIHFGVDPDGAAWKKNLRYADGDANTLGSYNNGSTPVGLRGNGTPAILQLDLLATAMGPKVWSTPPPAGDSFTGAQFALEMVEGVQAVSFQLSTTP